MRVDFSQNWHDELGDRRGMPGKLCCTIHATADRNESGRKAKRRSPGDIAFLMIPTLQRLDVFSLPAFGALGHFEFDRLALL
jgi:hypothetical protein